MVRIRRPQKPQRVMKSAPKVINLEERVKQLFDDGRKPREVEAVPTAPDAGASTASYEIRRPEKRLPKGMFGGARHAYPELADEDHALRLQRSVPDLENPDGRHRDDINEAIEFARKAAGVLPQDAGAAKQPAPLTMRQRLEVSQRVAQYKKRYRQRRPSSSSGPDDDDSGSSSGPRGILRSQPHVEPRSVKIRSTTLAGDVLERSVAKPSDLARNRRRGSSQRRTHEPLSRKPSARAAERLMHEAKELQQFALYQKVVHEEVRHQHSVKHGVKGHPEALPPMTRQLPPLPRNGLSKVAVAVKAVNAFKAAGKALPGVSGQGSDAEGSDSGEGGRGGGDEEGGLPPTGAALMRAVKRVKRKKSVKFKIEGEERCTTPTLGTSAAAAGAGGEEQDEQEVPGMMSSMTAAERAEAPPLGAMVLPGQRGPSKVKVKLQQAYLFAKFGQKLPTRSRRRGSTPDINPGCLSTMVRQVRSRWEVFKANRPAMLLSGRGAKIAVKAHLTASQLKAIRKRFFQVQHSAFNGFGDLEDKQRDYVPAFTEQHHTDSTIRTRDLMHALKLPRSRFSDILFNQAMGSAHISTRMTLGDFVCTVVVVASFTKQELYSALFSAFDTGGSGVLSEDEFVAMATTLNAGGGTFAGNVKRALEEFTWAKGKAIDWDVFLRLNERFPMLTYPAFEIQQAMQQWTLGSKTWVHITARMAAEEEVARYMREHGGMAPEPQHAWARAQRCGQGVKEWLRDTRVAVARKARQCSARGKSKLRRADPNASAAAAGFVGSKYGIPQGMIEKAWEATMPEEEEDAEEFMQQTQPRGDELEEQEETKAGHGEGYEEQKGSGVRSKDYSPLDAAATQLFVADGARAFVQAILVEHRAARAAEEEAEAADAAEPRSPQRRQRRKKGQAGKKKARFA